MDLLGNSRWSARALLAATVLLTQLPFLNQAVHIDDRIYLETAENILRQPWHPYDYPPLFEGLLSPDAASHSHLPLTAYYLALWRLLSESPAEVLYHAAFLVFPLAAAWGFYRLAARFVSFPLAASLLLVLSPAFAVLSHTLMTDVPLLAFWILSVQRFLVLADGNGRRQDRWIFSLSLLAAAFISLLTAGLLLLLAAWLLWRAGSLFRLFQRRENRVLLLLLALPLALWGFWYLRAYLHYDRFVLLHTWQHMRKREFLEATLMGEKVLSFLLNAGGVFLCPIALWYGLARPVSGRVTLFLFFLSFLPFYLWYTDWPFVSRLLFALFLSSGVLVFWEGVRRAREVLAGQRKGDLGPLLALWFFGIGAAYLVLFYAGSVRYALPALPPVILFWVKALEQRVESRYFLRNLIWLGVVLTGVYGAAISWGDYRFAGVYRQAAREIVADYREEGRTIWFTAEWGFRYYLEREGARILARTQTGPRPGDVIVKPFLASPWVTLYDDQGRTSLLEQRPAELGYPVRILDFDSKAGFYSTGWGLLPFSLGGERPWEWFNVFRVEQEYTGPIPESERHW